MKNVKTVYLNKFICGTIMISLIVLCICLFFVSTSFATTFYKHEDKHPKSLIKLQRRNIRILPFINRWNGIIITAIQNQTFKTLESTTANLIVRREFDNIPRPFSNDVDNSQEFLLKVYEPLNLETLFSGGNRIQISGEYRYPKGIQTNKYFNEKLKNPREHSNKVNQQVYFDPFSQYKPDSPSDVNELTVEKPQNMINNKQKLNSLQIIYGNARNYENSRNGFVNKRHKPLRLLLAIHPTPEDDASSLTFIHQPHKDKYRMPIVPLSSGPITVNNLSYSDHNSNKVSQISNNMHRGYNFFQNPYFRGIHRDSNNKYHSEYIPNLLSNKNNNPTIMMVHLNLLPKHKEINKIENEHDIPDIGSNINIKYHEIERINKSKDKIMKNNANFTEFNVNFKHPCVVIPNSIAAIKSNNLIRSENINHFNDFEKDFTLSKFDQDDAMRTNM